MNHTQVTAIINQYKNTINELQQTMLQNKKKMEIFISNKDSEISQIRQEISKKDSEISELKQEISQKDSEISELKQENINLLNGDDKQTIQNLKDNNIPFKKTGSFIILS